MDSTPLSNRVASRFFPDPGGAFGIEVEYGVYQGPTQIDFRRTLPKMIHTAGHNLSREKIRRYRWPDGTKLTSDGWYAEWAGPPEPTAPNLAETLSNSVLLGRNRLLAMLKEFGQSTSQAYSMDGYSMHFNIQQFTGTNQSEFAMQFARAYGPLILWLTNQPDSRGLLVRPRPGRLEIATEFIKEPPRLRATISLIQAAFQAMWHYKTHQDHACVSLSPADTPSATPIFLPETALVPTKIRYGWRLTPEALASVLRKKGKKALIQCQDRDAISFGTYLQHQWESLCPFLDQSNALDVKYLANIFNGRRKVPLENSNHATPKLRPVSIDQTLSPGGRIFEDIQQPRRIKQWNLSLHYLHWEFVVYRVCQGRTTVFLSLPRCRFVPFVERQLDDLILGMLKPYQSGRARKQTSHLGVLRKPASAGDLSIFRDVDRYELERGLEITAIGGKKWTLKKKKKKPRHEDPLCAVLQDDEGNIEICIPETADPQTPLGQQEPPRNDGSVAEGVWLHNGAFHHQRDDHEVKSLGFNFIFRRYYRSSVIYPGILGHNWDHQYNVRVVPERPQVHRPVKGGWCEKFDAAMKSGGLRYYHGTGRVTRHAFKNWEIREMKWCDGDFTAVVTTYAQNNGESFEIQRYAVLSGTPPSTIAEPIFYRIRFANGTRYLLNCHGYVVQIRDKNHNAMHFSYGLPFNPSTNYLVLRTIRDTLNRSYTLDYELIQGVPRIKKVKDFTGREVLLEYDHQIQLKDVTWPEGQAGKPKLNYRYQAGNRPGLVQEIVNPVEQHSSGTAYLENSYDNRERVVSQRIGDTQAASSSPGGSGGTGGRFQLRYANQSVTLVDRVGVEWRHRLRNLGDSKVMISLEVTDEAYIRGRFYNQRRIRNQYQFDPDFRIKKITHADGRVDEFQFKNINRPVTAGDERDDVRANITHHNDLGRDNLIRQIAIPSASGTGQAPRFTTSYQYEQLFNSVVEIKTPAGRTTLSYDHGHCSKPENNGNPVKVKHPGQLQPNGSSLPVLEQFEYGRGGQVTRYMDPDGIDHEMILDGKGRITARMIGGEKQSGFRYNDLGLVIERTDVRNEKTTYDYDGRDNLIQSTDPMGHVADTTYDLNDRITASSNEIYDDPTTLTGITTSPKLRLTSFFDYDILGNRIRLQQSARKVGPGTQPGRRRSWRWQYDGEERIILEETPRAVANEQFDARQVRVYNHRGQNTQLIEGANGPNQGITRMAYDLAGRLTYRSDPENRNTIWLHDGHGRPVEERWYNGTRILQQYRGLYANRRQVWGDISEGPASLGGRTLRQRLHSSCRLTTDASGREIARSELVFDPGRWALMRQVARYNAVSQVALTAAGRLREEIDPANRVIQYDYNAQGRLHLKKLPGGHQSIFSYDGDQVSLVTTTLQPDSGTTEAPPPIQLTLQHRRRYDKLGRMIEETSDNGVTTQRALDSMGNVRAEKGPLGQRTFEYDGFSRVVKRIQDGLSAPGTPNASIILTFEYDLNDNITRLKDGLNRSTIAKYNGREWMDSLTRPSQPTLTLKHFADGKVKEAIEGGRRVRYSYTQLGLLREASFMEGASRTTQAYGYDGVGRATWGTDTSRAPRYRSQVHSFRAYDSLGRLRAERTDIPQLNFARFVEQQYANDHLEHRLIYPSPNPDAVYRYGADAQLKQIREANRALSIPIINRLHQGPGRILESENKIVMTVGTGSTQQLYNMRIRQGQRFDSNGNPNRRNMRVSDEINRQGQPNNLISFGVPVEHLEFGNHGMIDRRTLDNLRFSFVYDGAERLKTLLEEEGSSDFRFTDHSWDVGNRPSELLQSIQQGGNPSSNDIRTVYTGRTRSDRTSGGTTRWTYDLFGRVERMRRPSTRTTRFFHYDGRDRLIRLTTFNAGLITLSGRNSFYHYDAFGRLVARTNDGSNPGEIFLHFGDRLLVEYDTQGTQQRRYIYDDQGKVVRYVYRDQASSGIVDTFPVNTLDGKPWLVLLRDIPLNQLTNIPGAGAGAVARSRYLQQRIPLVLEEHTQRPFQTERITRYTYYYGSDRSEQATAESVLPITTGGQRIFVDDELSIAGERFYDNTLRGFLTPDSIGAWGDPRALGNPYTFAGNNPIMYADNGNIALPVVTGIIGGVVGGAIGAYQTGTLGGALAGAATGALIGSGAGLLVGATSAAGATVAGISVTSASFTAGATVTGAGLGAAYFGRGGFQPGGFNVRADWENLARGAVYGAVAGYTVGRSATYFRGAPFRGGMDEWLVYLRETGLLTGMVSGATSSVTYAGTQYLNGNPVTAKGVFRAGAVGFVGGFVFSHLFTGVTGALTTRLRPLDVASHLGGNTGLRTILYQSVLRLPHNLHLTSSWVSGVGFGLASGMEQAKANKSGTLYTLGSLGVGATGSAEAISIMRGIDVGSRTFRTFGHLQAFSFGMISGTFMTSHVDQFLSELGF